METKWEVRERRVTCCLESKRGLQGLNVKFTKRQSGNRLLNLIHLEHPQTVVTDCGQSEDERLPLLFYYLRTPNSTIILQQRYCVWAHWNDL
ncbi:hypothetical protein EVAR_57827_1 [Eumeta japonica]|uniref:Uncharacterized protein n=1 Tax=Eumeta variegata TaxID=151549 RepID=A0A4C1ZWF8_EUMVA|nr:hypothetical protein EVAR_57827_1 [Eumeta japonica]